MNTTIVEKLNCCGCQACVQACPQDCISMYEDKEGFLYPKIDVENCNNCKLCVKSCPVLNQEDAIVPREVYAAINKNEDIVNTSSSGGIFYNLAESIINNHGVVFGARFNDKWEVVHDYTETIEGLARFMGSKYVQSYIGSSYTLTKQFLKKGTKVLYTGTPCQIAGLKRYLGKNYENLYTVDVVCHGVPSPKVWRRYLQLLSTTKPITNIVFRDKSTGWKKYSFVVRTSEKFGNVIEHNKHRSNIFMRGFLENLYLRPSCHACSFRNLKSNSDITLADFWNIEKILPVLPSGYNSDKGASCLMINSEKAYDVLDWKGMNKSIAKFEDALQSNKSIVNSYAPHQNRKKFFKKLNRNKNIECLIDDCLKPKQKVDIELLKKVVKKFLIKLN